MAAAGGPRLVVRNTFLEVFDDSPAPGETEGAQGRPRAQTDITDAKLPRKVSYPVEAEPNYAPGAGPVSPAPASYSPVRISGYPEESSHAALRGKGGGSALLTTASSLGAPGSMGVSALSGFPGPFPPPWGYPAMGAGAPAPPFPGLPGMPWGCPGAGFPPAVGEEQPQGGRGAGKRNQGRGGGGQRGNAPNRGGAGSKQQPANTGRGRASPVASQGQPQPQLSGADAASAGPQTSRSAEHITTGTETTVMLRNIPNRYTQSMLLSLLDEQQFKMTYDFVYLPMDFRNGVNLGYAFVNLLTHADALRFTEAFQGFSSWFFDSAKVCEVSWAHPHQGIQEHVERYRNSPVMHPTMPEEYKPMIFKDGEQVPFPLPTKAIRAPKLRPVHDRAAAAIQEQ